MPHNFDLSDFLPYQLAVLSERVSRRLSVEYGPPLGLSVAEWRVLVHLGRHGSLSVRDITARVNLEKPRVSRAVARLERAGLLEKRAAKGDRRLLVISLTAAGQEALGAIVPRALAMEAGLTAGVAPKDFAVFCAVMEKLHLALDADEDAPPRPG